MRYLKYAILSATALLGAFAAAQAEAAPTASLSLDPTASVIANRVAFTVTGTYTCGPVVVDNPNSDFADLTINVSQAAGQSLAHGVGALGGLLCDGNPQTFAIPVQAEDRPFHGGAAFADGSLFVQDCTADQSSCEQASARTQVQIRITGGSH